jgi:hypothetical protein
MRQFKIVLGILLTALILNVIVFFVFTVSGYDEIYDLVKKHSVETIDIFDDDVTEYNNIDEILKNETIFCVNEHGGVKANYDIMRNNITFYQKKHSMKYFVTDLSYSEALWMNQYMTLDDPAESFRKILIYEEALDVFLNIKQINDELDEKTKIEIIGVNAENSMEIPISYINYLFDQFAEKRKPDIINQVVNFDDSDEILYYQNMYDSLLNNERVYREYFVDKYFQFFMTLKNYIRTIENFDRNQMCLENFVDIYNSNFRAKYYIQLPLALSLYENLLAEYPNIAAEIYNMPLFYDNCESINDSDFYQYPFDLREDGTPITYILKNKTFKLFEKHRRLVYKINNRPYESYDIDMGNDYFILTNSPAVTLLEDSNDNN